MNKIKIFLIFFTAVIFFTALWLYINNFLIKSKASTDNVNINYLINNQNISKNTDFNFRISFSAQNQKKISAVDLIFVFDKPYPKQASIIFKDFKVTPSGYFNDTVEKKVFAFKGTPAIRLVLVSKKKTSDLGSGFILDLQFNSGNLDKEVNFELSGSSVIVGDAQGMVFNPVFPNPRYKKIVIGAGTPSLTPNPTPTATTPPSQPTSTPIPTPTATTPPSQPTSTPIPTPTATTAPGSVSLNLKLKFQGVMKMPANTDQRTMKVKIKVGGGSLSSPVPVDVNFTLTENRNSGSDALIWEGSVNLPSQVTPGQNYYLLVKGPKHIQKKICDQKPTETTGGSYACKSGRSITLNSGQNNLDFSGIYLLAGDLPVNGAQDGVVDSLDTSYIRNNLGKNNPEVISIADLNLDGRIDSQDWSSVIYALSIKTDEE